ncbi:uncharacterized protein LOC135819373 isoform X2 [Sycon ciliatum]|uniref:uncharacterized protein LOC135819373 isoform X2 n=1 Tax=Sycon ciliatum TaxID=27933 RepID=UPI0031F6CA91
MACCSALAKMVHVLMLTVMLVLMLCCHMSSAQLAIPVPSRLRLVGCYQNLPVVFGPGSGDAETTVTTLGPSMSSSSSSSSSSHHSGQQQPSTVVTLSADSNTVAMVAVDPSPAARVLQCGDPCLARGYPFFAVYVGNSVSSEDNANVDVAGATSSAGMQQLKCQCGHDIDGELTRRSQCVGDSATGSVQVNVYMHQPGLSGNVTWGRGLRSTLSCYGFPIKSDKFLFIWFRLSMTDGFAQFSNVSGEPGKYTVTAAGDIDVATYVCSARYLHGSSGSASTLATFTMGSKHATVTLIDPPTVQIVFPADDIQFVLAGSTVPFVCQVTGDSGVLHQSWERTERGEQHKLHHLQQSDSFQLGPVTNEHEGNYSCVAQRDGLDQHVRDTMQLIVLEPPRIAVSGSSELLGILGTRISLNCSGVFEYDLGMAGLHWNKTDSLCSPNQQPVSLLTSTGSTQRQTTTTSSSSSSSSIQSRPGSYTIFSEHHIGSVEVSDAGRYACTSSAESLSGCLAHDYVDLTVVEPLLLTTQLSHRVVQESVTTDVIYVYCRQETAISKTAPSYPVIVQWLKNGRPVDPRRRQSSRDGLQGATLVLTRPTKQDAGQYQCLVRYASMQDMRENWFASTPVSLYVDVAPSLHISPPSNITAASRSDLALVCTLSSSNSGPNTTIAWSRLMYGVNVTLISTRVSDADVAQHSAQNPLSLTLQLADVNQRDSGIYFCSAYDPSIVQVMLRRTVNTAYVDVLQSDGDGTATAADLGNDDDVSGGSEVQGGIGDAGQEDVTVPELDSASGGVATTGRHYVLLAGVFAGLFAVSLLLIIALLLSKRFAKDDEEADQTCTKGIQSPSFSPDSKHTRRGSVRRYLPVALRNAFSSRSPPSKSKSKSKRHGNGDVGGIPPDTEIASSSANHENTTRTSPASAFQERSSLRHSSSRMQQQQQQHPVKVETSAHARHSSLSSLVARRQNYEIPVDQVLSEENSFRPNTTSHGSLPLPIASGDLMIYDDTIVTAKRNTLPAKMPAQIMPMPMLEYDDIIVDKDPANPVVLAPTPAATTAATAAAAVRSGSGGDWQSLESFLSAAMPTAAMPTAAMPTAAMPTAAMPTAAMPTAAMPTAAMPTAASPVLEVDNGLQAPSPDYVPMSTVLPAHFLPMVGREFWPENLMLPATPSAGSFLDASPSTSQLLFDSAGPDQIAPAYNTRSTLSASWKGETVVSSGRNSRSYSRTPTPSNQGMLGLQNLRAALERDDGVTYDVPEQQEAKQTTAAIGERVYDTPDIHFENDNTSFVKLSTDNGVDIGSEKVQDDHEHQHRSDGGGRGDSSGDGGGSGGRVVDEPRRRWPRLSLKRSGSKRSTNSTAHTSTGASVDVTDDAAQAKVMKEVSKTVGSLSWLIHSAAGLIGRARSSTATPVPSASRPVSSNSADTYAKSKDGSNTTFNRHQHAAAMVTRNNTMTSSTQHTSPTTGNNNGVRTAYVPGAATRPRSAGADSYDVPFNAIKPSSQPAASSTLPVTSTSKKSFGMKSPAHYYNKLKFQMDPDSAAALASSRAAQVAEKDDSAAVYTEPLQQQQYQEPPSNEAAIYQTLSNQRYRHIHPDHIRMKQEIGSGRFGLVYRGLWIDGDCRTDVAVKTLRSDVEKRDRVLFLQEAAITGQFQHKNIVQLHGVVTHQRTILLVFELMTGNLRLYLNKIAPSEGREAPSELQRRLRRMCADVASGMAYLTERGFVHRDLAARNIMLDELSNCKVGDFGMSRIVDECDYYVCQGGVIPVKWSSPEAILYRQFSSASDVWSFGILMYEVWTYGVKPYGNWTNEKVIKELKNGYRLSCPSDCPFEIFCLMEACWEEDKHERPSFPEIVNLLQEIDELFRQRERQTQQQ